MSSSDPVVRLLKFMTHLNIGAAIGMFTWLFWSGWHVVTAQIEPPVPARAPTSALAQPQPSELRLIPVVSLRDGRPAAQAHCTTTELPQGHPAGLDL
jgi:hypothetical protein